MKKFFVNCCDNKSFCDGNTYSLSDIKYIVIHNTGLSGDIAKNNANYFLNNKNRYAGATYIIGRKGYVYQCCNLKYRPYAVGGGMYGGSGGIFYKKCTNYNSISIELCDILNKNISKRQLNSLKKIIKEIKKQCPNVVDIIRHYDVNSKPCPLNYVNEKKWKKLQKKLRRCI